MSNPHVLFINFGESGAKVQYPAMLANALTEYCDVSFIAQSFSGIQEMHSSDVNIFTVSPREVTSDVANLADKIRIYVRIIRLIREIDPDVMHLPFFSGKPLRVLMPAISRFSVPIVGTVHAPTTTGSARLTERDRKRRQAASMLDLILVHSEPIEERAVAAGYEEEKLHSIPHGLYTVFEKHTDPKDISLPEFDLLFFGNIRDNKGPDRIPAIMEYVRESCSDCRGVVVGSLANDDLYHHTILESLRACQSISLVEEYVPDEHVGAYFESAEIAVFPYYHCNSSAVLMTSYVFETPVVTTNEGALGRYPEIDGSGVVAAHNTDRHIGEAITELLLNENRRKECIANMNQAKSKYSWNSIAKEMLYYYRKAGARIESSQIEVA